MIHSKKRVVFINLESIVKFQTENELNSLNSVTASRDGWSLILSRLASTQSSIENQLSSVAQSLIEYILDDFKSRYDLAILWLHQEFFSNRLIYFEILNQIVSRLLDSDIEVKDRVFSRFLIDLPELDESVFEMLRKCCLTSRFVLCISSYKDIIKYRPKYRQEAIEVLISICTNVDRVVRAHAIVTVKRWYGVSGFNLSERIEQHAVECLNKLIPPKDEVQIKVESVAAPANDLTPNETAISPLASKDSDTKMEEVAPISLEVEVERQIDLYFSLCSKHTGEPDLLNMYYKFNLVFSKYTRNYLLRRNLLSEQLRNL